MSKQVSANISAPSVPLSTRHFLVLLHRKHQHTTYHRSTINNDLLNKRNYLFAKNNRLPTKRNYLFAKNNRLLSKRNHLFAKNNRLLTKRNHLSAKNNRLLTKRNHLSAKNNRLLTKRNHLSAKNNHLLTKNNHLSAHCHHGLAKKHPAISNHLDDVMSAKTLFSCLLPYSVIYPDNKSPPYSIGLSTWYSIEYACPQ